MAEKVRFELTVLAYTRVPGVHLKPLGHLSVMNATIIRLPGTAELGAFSILSPIFLQQKINGGFEKTPVKPGRIPRHILRLWSRIDD